MLVKKRSNFRVFRGHDIPGAFWDHEDSVYYADDSEYNSITLCVPRYVAEGLANIIYGEANRQCFMLEECEGDQIVWFGIVFRENEDSEKRLRIVEIFKRTVIALKEAYREGVSEGIMPLIT